MNVTPQPLHHITIGRPDAPPVVYGHGWGRSHLDFVPTAETLTMFASSHLLDLPGFGASRRPADTWGSSEYSDFLANHIRHHIGPSIVWVGHSFGGRIGLQLAVRHPDLVRSMLLVGSAGIPRRRTLLMRVKARCRQQYFKLLKRRAGSQRELDALEWRFGSPDYIESKKAGMRDIFLKVVNENQDRFLPSIRVHTHFVYGANDEETPPELGLRMSALVPRSSIDIVPEFDHHSILSRGYHILARRIRTLCSEE